MITDSLKRILDHFRRLSFVTSMPIPLEESPTPLGESWLEYLMARIINLKYLGVRLYITSRKVHFCRLGLLSPEAFVTWGFCNLRLLSTGAFVAWGYCRLRPHHPNKLMSPTPFSSNRSPSVTSPSSAAKNRMLTINSQPKHV